MTKYALQRMFLLIPSLVIISFVTFALIRFIPGDTAVAMTEELGYAANLEELRSLLGIDRPIHVQYFDWVGGFFRGDFGHSLWDGSDAMHILLPGSDRQSTRAAQENSGDAHPTVQVCDVWKTCSKR